MFLASWSRVAPAIEAANQVPPVPRIGRFTEQPLVAEVFFWGAMIDVRDWRGLDHVVVYLLADCAGGLAAHQRYEPCPVRPLRSATRQGWSDGNGGCDDFMKVRELSCGWKARPARA